MTTSGVAENGRSNSVQQQVSRPAARFLAVLALLAGMVVSLAAPAQAHAVLVGTTPAAGYSVAGPVRRVTLTFSEAVSATPDAVRVTGPTPARPVTVAADRGRTLVVDTGLLRDGVYGVHWQVTADDGDVVEGSYRFAVGTQTPLTTTGTEAATGVSGSLVHTALLRWGLFVGLAITLGGIAGQALAARLQRLATKVGARPLPPVVPLPTRIGAAVGGLATLGLTVHALDGTSWLTGLTRLMSWAALSGRGARLPAVEAVLFAFTALSTALPARLRGLAVAPLLGVALAEGFRSHLHEQDGMAGALLIAVHVALAATWTGALVVVLRTAASWRTAGRGGAGRQLVASYSRAALVVYLLVTATGTGAGVLILPSPQSLVRTGYGQVLCGKLVLVAMVTLLAMHSRQGLRRQEPDFTVNGWHRLQPRVMTALLALTAVLVSLSPPRLTALAQQATPPPAPTGPVEQFGALAGQLTVGVSVSAGQLRLQVRSPASDDGRPETFQVTARASGPGTSAQPVTLVGCGPGCSAAPLPVAAPGLLVLLDATSPGWHGARVSVNVPWPPTSGSAVLTRALALLRATRTLALVEQVTSDTSRAAPAPIALRDSGSQLLSTEPYGDPAALSPFMLSPQAGARRVAFGVAGTYFIEFTLDAAGRISVERLVTPNHLIRRRLTYSR